MIFIVLAPLALAAVAFALGPRRRPPLVPLAGGLAHLSGVVALFRSPPAPTLGGWLEFDPLAQIVLGTTSLLFMVCAVYAQGYLARRSERDNRVFVGGLLVLLSAMTVVALSQHLGLLWVAIELTTLSTAPLIYFERTAPALEAAWKYLLVCSLGIAFALLGYGTKMGLAPLHSWKPDSYGEAPGLLGALLSGGVSSVAFVAVARVVQVCGAAGESAFARAALVGMGLASMALASAFIVGQRDFKRMLGQ